MEIPIGLVPGGSGNALNCSVLHQLDQPLDGVNNLGAKHSAMNVALGAKAQPLLTSKHARSFYHTPFPIKICGFTRELIFKINQNTSACSCGGFLFARQAPSGGGYAGFVTGQRTKMAGKVL